MAGEPARGAVRLPASGAVGAVLSLARLDRLRELCAVVELDVAVLEVVHVHGHLASDRAAAATPRHLKAPLGPPRAPNTRLFRSP